MFGGVTTELTLDGYNTVGDVKSLIETTGLSVTLDSDATAISINAGASEFSIGGAETHGNTSAASIPIALHEAVQEGRVSPGDLVCLGAFGAGFTWAAALMRW